MSNKEIKSVNVIVNQLTKEANEAQVKANELLIEARSIKSSITTLTNLAKQLNKRKFKCKLITKDLTNINLTGKSNGLTYFITRIYNEGSPVFSVTFKELDNIILLPKTFTETEVSIKSIRINIPK